MKRIYISQPMKGLSEKEIEVERYKAVQKISKLIGYDYQIIDTIYTDFSPDAKPLEFLARSIKDLSTADVAIFVGEWDQFRGCKVEYTCATQYGIPTIIL